MLRTSLGAFLKSDAVKARKGLAEDDTVDAINREIIELIVERMKADSGQVDDALLLLPASKNLERTADHATNIAEDVVYMVEGDLIRYQPTG